MLPRPVTPSRPVLDGLHMLPPSSRATRCKAAVKTPSAPPAYPTGLCCPATRIGHAAQNSHPQTRHRDVRCAAAETATELVSATERFVEEFQAAEQRSDSEQTGHLVSLQEQLQAARMKVCSRIRALRPKTRPCPCFPWWRVLVGRQ